MAVVAAVVVLLFGSLYPNLVPSTLNPDWSLTIYNASSTPVHAEDHDLGGADLRPAGDAVPGLDVLGVPATDLSRADPRIDRAVEAVDVNLWRVRASAAMRRYLLASVACGVLISGSTIASAVVLAQIVAGVITEPASRSAGALGWAAVDPGGAVGDSHARAVAAGPAVPARRDRGDRRPGRRRCCAPSPRCHRGSSPRSAIPPPR